MTSEKVFETFFVNKYLRYFRKISEISLINFISVNVLVKVVSQIVLKRLTIFKYLLFNFLENFSFFINQIRVSTHVSLIQSYRCQHMNFNMILCYIHSLDYFLKRFESLWKRGAFEIV